PLNAIMATEWLIEQRTRGAAAPDGALTGRHARPTHRAAPEGHPSDPGRVAAGGHPPDSASWHPRPDAAPAAPPADPPQTCGAASRARPPDSVRVAGGRATVRWLPKPRRGAGRGDAPRRPPDPRRVWALHARRALRRGRRHSHAAVKGRGAAPLPQRHRRKPR